ncbi:MAG: helix-turn-helix transcriptional regulator [Firmicutes bacterium]|nr:helix-turn-helix transcriptional regulator [Bacillota bacterium]
MQTTEFTILFKSLRASNNLTLTSLSEELNLSLTYLRDLENGNRKPNEKIVESLITFYNLDNAQKRILYDAVAKSTDSLPFDIVRFLKNNPVSLAHVIEIMEQSNSKKEGR